MKRTYNLYNRAENLDHRDRLQGSDFKVKTHTSTSFLTNRVR